MLVVYPIDFFLFFQKSFDEWSILFLFFLVDLWNMMINRGMEWDSFRFPLGSSAVQRPTEGLKAKRDSKSVEFQEMNADNNNNPKFIFIAIYSH